MPKNFCSSFRACTAGAFVALIAGLVAPNAFAYRAYREAICVSAAPSGPDADWRKVEVAIGKAKADPDGAVKTFITIFLADDGFASFDEGVSVAQRVVARMRSADSGLASWPVDFRFLVHDDKECRGRGAVNVEISILLNERRKRNGFAADGDPDVNE